jgi:hypothetical protein
MLAHRGPAPLEMPLLESLCLLLKAINAIRTSTISRAGRFDWKISSDAWYVPSHTLTQEVITLNCECQRSSDFEYSS